MTDKQKVDVLPITAESKITYSQKRTFGPRAIAGWGDGAAITAEVRYDDDCRNGHNSFAITGEIRIPGRRDIEAGGCLHDEIAKSFPELAPFIKWHLCSSDGPMHYTANTVFMASERDCWGKLKGEPKAWDRFITFGDNPIKHAPGRRDSTKFVTWIEEHRAGVGCEFDFEVIPYYHEDRPGENYKFEPKFTFGGFAEKWHECPFETERQALNFLYALQHCDPKFVTVATAWGEGKARDLDGARRAAVWPDATDEDLTAPGLEDRLHARLPGLLAEFRAAVEFLGFTW